MAHWFICYVWPYFDVWFLFHLVLQFMPTLKWKTIERKKKRIQYQFCTNLTKNIEEEEKNNWIRLRERVYNFQLILYVFQLVMNNITHKCAWKKHVRTSSDRASFFTASVMKRGPKKLAEKYFFSLPLSIFLSTLELLYYVW